MPGYFAKNEQHRRLVLKALLWITLSGGLFFSVVNLLHDNWLLASLEIGYAAVSLYLLTIVDRTRNLQLLTAVYLLPFFSIMILALAQTHTSFAVFAWIQSIPIICYLLLGLRLGMYGSVLFVGIGLFVFSRRFSSDQLLQNVEIIANLGLASLAVMIFAHIYERSRLLNEQRLTDQATTDSLTGLPNRLKLAEVFERERAHAQRNGTPLSLVFVDIDHFKQINDRFGHHVGDQVLVAFVELIKRCSRKEDRLFRFGGEEFLLLLPNTELTGLQAAAQNLLSWVAQELKSPGGAVTVSIGGAILHSGEHWESWLQRADECLYRAKSEGRNRAVIADASNDQSKTAKSR